MSYRAHVEHDFVRDRLAVHIGQIQPNGHMAVARPIDIVLEEVPDGIATEPALYIDHELARVLYDALGKALSIHTPDARLAAETLSREQDRVDKFIDHLTGGT